MTGPAPADPYDLELRWLALTPPVGDRLAAERVRDWAGGPVLVALDAYGARHLLVRVDHDRSARLPRPVAGMELAVRHLHPAGQPDASWIDLACSDASWHRTFGGLCADVIAELPGDGPADPATLLAVLERWRRFWANDRDGLTRDEQLGLLGELWLLLEWLPRVTVDALTAWQGPLRGRHDFVTETVSIEVKTTRTATGPVVHRVARLDQLDEPGVGQLYLLSLRAVPDPLGSDDLDTLLHRSRAAAAAAGTTCSALLDDRLRAVGVTPADDGRYVEPLRVSQQELYRVESDFPRLVASSFPHGLPAGVIDVAYSLDISACKPWLISDKPVVDVLSAPRQ
jgi:hypothetical protein